ncbi:uroporphyrinogen decarboxylase [Pelagibacteraceae bacterium]|nr:uroporphyrinogen decarboxylase [Pelagibacteraceae bacterium]
MSKLLNCLINKDSSCVPIWFMRQAGRYLPEFRQIRKKNPDFLKLCFNSNLATEITLQPIKRFNLDAAIIFSDILVIPYALRQKIEFREKSGPWNSNFNIDKFLETKKEDFLATLKPIYEAIKKTKYTLQKEKALISFIGAPWTLIVYLYNLKEQISATSKITLHNKEEVKLVLKKLDEFLKLHIIHQKEAGAEIVQIFDSWAGLIQEENLEDYCFNPNKSLVDFCRKNNIPSICFPRGLKNSYKKFIEIVKPDAINIDQEIDPIWAKQNLHNICIQGGMNPELLLKSEESVLEETERYLEIFKNNPYIFNLGHGILPETNPNIVKKIVERVNLIKR